MEYDVKVWSHDMIFRPISKRFCICGRGNTNDQVFTQSEFLIDFTRIINLFHLSHDTILIRLSDRNWKPIDLKRTFRSNFQHSFFAFKQYDFCQKEKSNGNRIIWPHLKKYCCVVKKWYAFNFIFL